MRTVTQDNRGDCPQIISVFHAPASFGQPFDLLPETGNQSLKKEVAQSHHIVVPLRTRVRMQKGHQHKAGASLQRHSYTVKLAVSDMSLPKVKKLSTIVNQAQVIITPKIPYFILKFAVKSYSINITPLKAFFKHQLPIKFRYLTDIRQQICLSWFQLFLRSIKVVLSVYRWFIHTF